MRRIYVFSMHHCVLLKQSSSPVCYTLRNNVYLCELKCTNLGRVSNVDQKHFDRELTSENCWPIIMQYYDEYAFSTVIMVKTRLFYGSKIRDSFFL